jgi:hypothetical protein
LSQVFLNCRLGGEWTVKKEEEVLKAGRQAGKHVNRNRIEKEEVIQGEYYQ